MKWYKMIYTVYVLYLILPLEIVFESSSVLLHLVLVCSLMWTIPLYEYSDFTHPLVDGHLGCFQIRAIRSSVALNIVM